MSPIMYPPLTYVMIISGLFLWCAATYFTWRLSKDKQVLVSTAFTYALVIVSLPLALFCLLSFNLLALLVNIAALIASIVLVIVQFRTEERQHKG